MPSIPEVQSNHTSTNDMLLQVENLKTYFFTRPGVVKAVNDVSFYLKNGECLCLVGESGCGKTATALSILKLIDSPPGKIVSGHVWFHNVDLLQLPNKEIRSIRGNRVSMIFQDPQSSFNPVLTIGAQIEEQLKLHQKLNRGETKTKIINLMKMVGIPEADKRISDYPHQFSGGMRQRAMIAMALSCDPEMVIADEPTTALDVTVKAQIVDIFKSLKEQRQMSFLFITHDFGVVAQIADRIMVMYAGKIVEGGTTNDIFDNPRHPYTIGLINCLPDVSTSKERLEPIAGFIPSLINPPSGCHFHPRCPRVMPVCSQIDPHDIVISPGHTVVCHLYD